MKKQTPKRYLQKGVNLMVATLFLLIFSPLVINVGFKVQQKANINFVLYIGILLAGITIILFFLGLRSILKYLFER